MPNKPSGSHKKSSHSRPVKPSRQGIGQRINNSKQFGVRRKERKGQTSRGKMTADAEKRLINCIVVYTLFLLTASILWGLQVPKQVVFVLLVIPTLLIPPYLIPLRTRYTKVVYGSLILMIITILIAVLSFDQKSVLQVLSYLFPIFSK